MNEPKEYSQPTSAPVPKMQAVAAASAAITIIVAVLAVFGIIVPPGVSEQASAGIGALFVIISAVQGIVAFIAGYIKKDVKPAEAVKIIKEDMKG